MCETLHWRVEWLLVHAINLAECRASTPEDSTVDLLTPALKFTARITVDEHLSRLCNDADADESSRVFDSLLAGAVPGAACGPVRA